MSSIDLATQGDTPSPLRTVYRPILALRTAYRHFYGPTYCVPFNSKINYAETVEFRLRSHFILQSDRGNQYFLEWRKKVVIFYSIATSIHLK